MERFYVHEVNQQVKYLRFVQIFLHKSFFVFKSYCSISWICKFKTVAAVIFIFSGQSKKSFLIMTILRSIRKAKITCDFPSLPHRLRISIYYFVSFFDNVKDWKFYVLKANLLSREFKVQIFFALVFLLLVC